MKKELETALNTIKTVCEQFKGTKQDHIAIEQCIRLIEGELSRVCSCENCPEPKSVTVETVEG